MVESERPLNSCRARRLAALMYLALRKTTVLESWGRFPAILVPDAAPFSQVAGFFSKASTARSDSSKMYSEEEDSLSQLAGLAKA